MRWWRSDDAYMYMPMCTFAFCNVDGDITDIDQTTHVTHVDLRMPEQVIDVAKGVEKVFTCRLDHDIHLSAYHVDGGAAITMTHIGNLGKTSATKACGENSSIEAFKYLDGIVDPCIVVDLSNSSVIYANKAEKVRSGEQYYQDIVKQLFHCEQDDVSTDSAVVNELLMCQEARKVFVRLPCDTVGLVDYEISVSKVNSTSSESVIIMRDISELVETKKMMIRKTNMLQAILDVSDSRICFFEGENLSVVHCNGWLSATRLHSADMKGKNCVDFISHVDEVLNGVDDPKIESQLFEFQDYLAESELKMGKLVQELSEGGKGVSVYAEIPDGINNYYTKRKAFFVDGDSTPYIVVEARNVNDSFAKATLLSTVLDVVPDAITVKETKEFRLVEASAEACRMLGRNRDELIGLSDVDLAGEHMSETMNHRRISDQRLIDDLLQDGSGYEDYEYETPFGVGSEIFSVHNRAFLCPGNDSPYILSVVRNITQLRAGERLLRTFLNSIPDMITVKDASTMRFIEINTAASTAMGVQEDGSRVSSSDNKYKMFDVGSDDYLDSGSHSIDRKLVQDYMSGGPQMVDFSKDEYNVRKLVLRLPGRENVIIMTLMRDMSAILDTQHVLRTIINTIPDSISVKDAETKVYVEVNQATVDVFGRPYDQIVGSNFGKAFKQVDQPLVGRNQDMDQHVMETFHETGDGFVEYTEGNLNVRKLVYQLPSTSKHYILTIGRDMTTQNETKEMLASVLNVIPHPMIISIFETNTIVAVSEETRKEANLKPNELDRPASFLDTFGGDKAANFAFGHEQVGRMHKYMVDKLDQGGTERAWSLISYGPNVYAGSNTVYRPISNFRDTKSIVCTMYTKMRCRKSDYLDEEASFIDAFRQFVYACRQVDFEDFDFYTIGNVPDRINSTQKELDAVFVNLVQWMRESTSRMEARIIGELQEVPDKIVDVTIHAAYDGPLTNDRIVDALQSGKGNNLALLVDSLKKFNGFLKVEDGSIKVCFSLHFCI